MVEVHEFADKHQDIAREEARDEFRRCYREIDELTRDDTPQEVIQQVALQKMEKRLN